MQAAPNGAVLFFAQNRERGAAVGDQYVDVLALERAGDDVLLLLAARDADYGRDALEVVQCGRDDAVHQRGFAGMPVDVDITPADIANSALVA
ncbi:hypothetical protein SDC9_170407 [bioreactor metagenome]|uniref:Uncharacterized protein n=1 Tax=bioreactor metagenome TaxID=1076179 RepID=A0A645GAL8_9ZZZZ